MGRGFADAHDADVALFLKGMGVLDMLDKKDRLGGEAQTDLQGQKGQQNPSEDEEKADREFGGIVRHRSRGQVTKNIITAPVRNKIFYSGESRGPVRCVMTKSLPNKGFLVKCFLSLEGFGGCFATEPGGSTTNPF